MIWFTASTEKRIKYVESDTTIVSYRVAMLSLELHSGLCHSDLMSGNTEPSEAVKRRVSAALKLLRKRSGMSGEAVAHEAGMHPQTYRNYENGRRMPDDATVEAIMMAMGFDMSDYAAQLRELPDKITKETFGYRPPSDPSIAAALAERGRDLLLPVGGYAFGGAARPAMYDLLEDPEVLDFAEYFASGTRVLRLGGMSMVPYAEPGGFVTYNPRRPARRGQGAVIELADGSYHVKRFERTTEDKLIVTELYPVEREIEFDLKDVVGVYAIGLRGD